MQDGQHGPSKCVGQSTGNIQSTAPGVHTPRDESFQAWFHHHWGHLGDRNVRDLAWLLVSPDLLDPAAPQWGGQIATLSQTPVGQLRPWLDRLDADPSPLHQALRLQPFSRLGRYAEQLMAYYFRQQGILFANGVQVREGKSSTIGEFDFLLRSGQTLLHWEFATKFYLYEESAASSFADSDSNYFLGPNLADTLGKKVRKILERQLALARHPAAQAHLPLPVAMAQALVKGWLFYNGLGLPDATALGLSPNHCRGFWCPVGGLDAVSGEHFLPLPRLHWLAPAVAAGDGMSALLDRDQLRQSLASHFAMDVLPVMVACMQEIDGIAREMQRGFIVPDDWRSRAAARTV